MHLTTATHPQQDLLLWLLMAESLLLVLLVLVLDDDVEKALTPATLGGNRNLLE
jgi:hypothetical protein